jgi:hypothetical protein
LLVWGAVVSLEGPDELLRNREEIYQVSNEEWRKDKLSIVNALIKESQEKK